MATIADVVKFIFTHTEHWERKSLDEKDFKLTIIPNEEKYYAYKFPYQFEVWVDAIKKGNKMNENTNPLAPELTPEQQPTPNPQTPGVVQTPDDEGANDTVIVQ